MISTLLQARQLLDAVGWTYTIEEVQPDQVARIKELGQVPEGIETLSFIMIPADLPKSGPWVVFFDGKLEYCGTYWPKKRLFVPSGSRSRFEDFDRR